MNFTFEIPRNNKELLTDADCSNYFVKQIYDADQISTQLHGNAILINFLLFIPLSKC